MPRPRPPLIPDTAGCADMSGGKAPEGSYTSPRQSVSFGPGAVRTLGPRLAQLGVDRAMIVTGPTVADLPVRGSVEDAAAPSSTSVFSQVGSHNPIEACVEGWEAMKSDGAQALIATGGSSCVDAARTICAIEAAGTTDLLDGPRQPVPLSTEKIVPIMTATTTLSQGEFTNIAGVTNSATGTKHLLVHDDLTPTHVVLDAELTLQTPESLWLSTAVKALDTAIDQFLSWKATQAFHDPLLLAAVKELLQLLRTPESHRNAVRTRQQMQVAAWMGAFPRWHMPTSATTPTANGWFGAAARHQIGGMLGAPHGILAGILLPPSLEFHLSSRRERQTRMAHALGLPRAEALQRVSREIVTELGLPTHLGDVGMEASDVPRVANAIVEEVPAFGHRFDEVCRSLETVL